MIGPSGCGKSTLLRVLNRMYDLYPEPARRGRDPARRAEHPRRPTIDLNVLRARIGMVFQKPTPFPMSIYDNIAFGVRLYEKLRRAEMDERVEGALRKAALWDEVKDKLTPSGLGLSGGQQQRLCIARTIAREARGGAARRAELGARPDLDRQDRRADRRAEAPTSPSSSSRTTCSRRRACADYTAFMYLGELIEFGADRPRCSPTPSKSRTQDYITGRFG